MDKRIDIIVGIAVFFMILANFSPYFINEPSFIFRLFYSIVAPIFIIFSNFTITYNYYFKKYSYFYYFKRGLYIIMWAIFVDCFIYKIFPFNSFGVLYIIGFSIIINSFFLKLSPFLIFIISNFIFILTPFLHIKLGYNKTPFEANLFDFNSFYFILKNYSLKHFLIDGYFPIFPFLGIALTGIFFFDLYYNKREIFFKKSLFLISLLIFLFLSLKLYNIKDMLFIRGGSAGLFYPPTIYFIYWSLSLVFVLFYLLLNIPDSILNNNKFFIFLTNLGKNALFIYVFHLFFAEYFFKFIENFFKIHNTKFSLFYLILFYILFLIILNYLINFLSILKKINEI
ncbi:MAG: heparan-alpha-glucosaminide N-acetyltransferase domain-containing protein [bacterium]